MLATLVSDTEKNAGTVLKKFRLRIFNTFWGYVSFVEKSVKTIIALWKIKKSLTKNKRLKDVI